MTKKNALFKTPLFYQNRVMSGIFYQIESQQKVLHSIRSILPEPLAQHVQYCLIKEGKLLVYTDAAVWATQLRFYNAALLAGVSGFVKGTLESVQIKIITEQTGLVTRPLRKVRIPSLQTINLIQNDCQSINDSELKLSLLKLSLTLKRKYLTGA